jgi:hypothetical protein
VYLNNVRRNFLQDNIWMIVLIAMFLISVGTYLLTHFGQERFLLYFPDSLDDQLVGEYRVLPRERGREQRIGQLVEEVILGPSNILSYNIFQRSTSLRSVYLVRPSVAIIDLDREAMDRIRDRELTVSQSLEILRKTIEANFPGLREIRVLIDGQEPYFPPYAPDAAE